MATYFRLLIVVLLFWSCSKEEYIEDYSLPIPTLELDGRLPIDENGYYHLVLDSTTNQTIHRISGRLLNTIQPTKVHWDSNLYWWLMDGDTIANITKAYINYFTGEFTYVNLPPFVNWKKALVPTINSTSIVGTNGEINTVIAPIYRMKNDTLVINCTINEWDIMQNIKIVLE
jgi:hypothetical protein